MEKVAEAYALTEVIYETFLEMADEGLLSELNEGEGMAVRLAPNRQQTQPRQLIASGIMNGREVEQTLSRSDHDDHFYLFTKKGGRATKRISPTPRLGERQNHTDAIEDTVFMEQFIRFGMDRVLAASSPFSE